MVSGAIVGAFVIVALERRYADDLSRRMTWLAPGGADAVRSVLGVLAGSVITIAGVAYSILIVALSLASQQLGPRVLVAFRADRGIQVVLGTFVATFTFCILVMSRVGRSNGEEPIPYLGVGIALLLGLLSVGVLIYFIHHAAAVIQADYVIAAIGSDLRWTIRRLLTNDDDESAPQPTPADMPAADFEQTARCISTGASGYIRTIDHAHLVAIARRYDLLVRVERPAGRFVLPETAVLRAYPAEAVDDRVARQLWRAIALGCTRTHAQDVEFGINQLVEIAVRALSPGINDPSTAQRCVDRLAEALRTILCTPRPRTIHRDCTGRVRLLTPPMHIDDLFDAALHQIRQNSVGKPSMAIHMIQTLTLLVSAAGTEAGRRAIRRHADLIMYDNEAALKNPSDLEDLRRRHIALHAEANQAAGQQQAN